MPPLLRVALFFSVVRGIPVAFFQNRSVDHLHVDPHHPADPSKEGPCSKDNPLSGP